MEQNNTNAAGGNIDLFNGNLPPQNDINDAEMFTELPSVPPEQPSVNSELSFVAGKFFISFGVMLVCIVVIIFGLNLFKNRLKAMNLQDDNLYKVKEPKQADAKSSSELKSKTKQAKKISPLSTPQTVTQCIRAFLENTGKN